MAGVNGPTIVRPGVSSYYVKPGLHSHNARRRPPEVRRFAVVLRFIRTALLIVGLCGIGYYAYTVSDQYVYQVYQNWAFDQQIAGRRNVTFADYIREQTPFGFLVGTKAAEPANVETAQKATGQPEAPRPAPGSLLGRVEIARLNVSAMVREGVDAKTLSLAVGHVPSTALPGETGNFAIAAHRDTLFRALKDIERGDLVTFESAAGTYTYTVAATKIVTPSDVSVLRPDGGGLISPGTAASNDQHPDKLLTMITCYPFYYVGSAPKRFIVEAKLVSNDPETKFASDTLNGSLPEADDQHKTHTQRKLSDVRSPHTASHLVKPQAHRNGDQHAAKDETAKKRGFWHKLFHL